MPNQRMKMAFSEKEKMIITAYAFITKTSKNKAIRKAIQGLYDDIGKYEERKLLDTWYEMTEEQRKFPKRW